MIAHQHMSVDLPPRFSARLRQARHKHVAILVVAINGLLMIPSAHDACLAAASVRRWMVNRFRILNTLFALHDSQTACPTKARQFLNSRTGPFTKNRGDSFVPVPRSLSICLSFPRAYAY